MSLLQQVFMHWIARVLLVIASLSAFTPDDHRTPMLGWSSWNTFQGNINESVIKATADAMVKNGMKDAGYRYINVDDGYFAPRNSAGEFQYNTTKFPGGMKALADYIHDLGLKAGTYSDAGDNACGGSRGVGFYNHEEADAKLFFNTWGYDFVKVDWCGGSNLRLSMQEQYTKIWNAIKKAQPAGKEVRYNLCSWTYPGTWTLEVAGSWRMSSDITDRFNSNGYPNDSVVSIMKENLYLSAYAAPGHFNDMDMMEIGRGTFTVDEEKSHFGLWSILSSPILIGCDLRSIPNSTLNIITNPEVLEVHQDVLGIQAKVVTTGTNSYVLAKPLEDLHGTARAVALFNYATSAANLSVNFADLHIAGRVTVRDLFNRQDLGVFTNSFSASVPAHGILMLRLDGEEYVERTVYDAQDIFLHDFTTDNPGQNTARLVELASASSGRKVGTLGNSATNWGEFQDVYSVSGGAYDLAIEYYSDGTARSLTVSVDGDHHGENHSLTGLTGPNLTTVQTTHVSIQLDKGVNVIRLGQSSGRAPDVNRIVLTPQR